VNFRAPQQLGGPRKRTEPESKPESNFSGADLRVRSGRGPESPSPRKEESYLLWTRESESKEESDLLWTRESESKGGSDLLSTGESESKGGSD
jgi:hypothetical protein